MPPTDSVTTFGDAGRPGVLLLHPWWGVTPAMRWWAEQLAANGRHVVLPDFYGGVVAATVEEAEALEGAFDYAAAGALAAGYADDLAANGPWAAMGFSMGAFLACTLTGRGAADPRDLILFYGGRLPDRPAVATRHVDLHVAPGDPWFGAEEVAAVDAAFRQAGADVTVHTYDGSGHWFAEEGSPAYAAAAAALARDRVLARLRP
jgi:carboxymethylenebutenolidase